MTSRLNYAKAAPGVMKAMLGLESYLATTGLDKGLKLLVVLRASQMNNCAYCIDMHTQELREHPGITTRRSCGGMLQEQ